MDKATEILIIGGMFILAFGLLLGIPMAMTRSKASRAPRYLFAAHLASIIHGGLLLALTIAIGFAALASWAETIAAYFLVAGMALFDIGLALNWIQGVEDGFGEKSVGNKVSFLGTPLVLIGAGIILYGVVAAL